MPLSTYIYIWLNFCILASMISERVDAASVVIDNVLWVTGGITPTGYLKSTEFYDFKTNQWSNGPDLPAPLSKHEVTLLDNTTALISGGKNLLTWHKFNSMFT